ncbi:IclR family transcriptional regulator C-terminal domain-containing protein [Streptomyces apocyni]|uniref:IclR family transcriptional regulator C-terminal domain-containing protein n=1 Tax=Streptomyces apocyni TaxID=2654677 RepID=UPI001E3EC742|nr:IclR family transcriptional regulator C-terminal domain-containing protein [Streptomyces apocyni]
MSLKSVRRHDGDHRRRVDGLAPPSCVATRLEIARGIGHALDDRELTLGGGGAAASVFDRIAEVVGGLGLVGSVERLSVDSARHECAIAFRGVARSLSRDLGAPRKRESAR